jgi:hypothetical protein
METRGTRGLGERQRQSATLLLAIGDVCLVLRKRHRCGSDRANVEYQLGRKVCFLFDLTVERPELHHGSKPASFPSSHD